MAPRISAAASAARSRSSPFWPHAQALLGFLYNTVILALALNLIVGQLG
jgi:uncharacterized membrane protein